MPPINLKGVVSKALTQVIAKLIILKMRIAGEEFEEFEQEDPRCWSVYLLNTKTHFAVVAAREDITEMIPDDGSFISGIILYNGLTEGAARVKVTELEGKLGPSDELDPDLS